MIDKSKMPVHVAIIMDGNGRWAARRKLPKQAGHNAGMLAMIKIVRESNNLGIKYLTLYAFSTENWKRPKEETGGIFKLLVKYVDSELAELDEENVRLRVLGDYTVIPAAAKESLEKALEATKNNTGLQLSIALNYGSRAEIVRAVNRLKDDIERGVPAGAITEEAISRRLYTGDENGNIPDPDLIIRTSGEERLSNFMLWQGAYSELEFTDVLWPDFSPAEYRKAIEDYQGRSRRFGGRS